MGVTGLRLFYQMDNNKKEISELRQDPVSKDWVIVSTGREERPSAYKSSFGSDQETPIDLCPFEDPKKHGNEVVKSFYRKGESGWIVQVVKNKFPIVKGENCRGEESRGPFTVQTQAGGYHEVVITRDHRKSFAQMDVGDVEIVAQVYQERFRELEKRECASYVLIFHNHGRGAGASVSHPHSQILAIPFVPSDVRRSLEGSSRYWNNQKRCVHCDIIEWELKEKKRIIFENESIVAFVPYAPDFSYEVRIFPKKHESYFEESQNTRDLAEALKVSLAKIYRGLGDPPYNFFIHTSPTGRNNEYDYYHWHLEINPRTNIWGGFELGTGGDVISVDPDKAAEYLRSIKI